MSGFENNIINNLNALIRSAIKSPNYIAGVSGWSINKDGSAEFNNLTIRGTFKGTNFEINVNGIFFYSGTPALGNLIAWISNSDGTDSHGNAYYKGLGSTLPGSQVSLLQDGVLAVGSPAQTTASIQALFDWISDGESALTSGKVNVSDPVQAVLDLQSQSKSGITNGLAYFEVGKLILGITATAWFDDNAQKLLIPRIGATISGSAETWHDMRPLGNSFVGTISGQYPPQYRLAADGYVDVVGFIQFPSTDRNNNSLAFFTMPSAYRPGSNAGHKWPAMMATNATSAPESTPCVQVDTTGALVFHNFPSTGQGMASNIVCINGRYPLDNTGLITS